jgi:hypothetical protein
MTLNRIWVGGQVTIEPVTGKAYVVRRPTDKKHSPGPNDWTCIAVVDSKKCCNIKILNGLRSPTRKEINQLWEYFQSLGCTSGRWERHKHGKPAKEVIVLNLSNNSKLK